MTGTIIRNVLNARRGFLGHMLERHLKTQHNIYYTCPECSKTFLKKSVFNENIKSHSNNKPHNCCMCSKTFSLQANLRKHKQEHSKDENHPCETCDKKLVIKLMMEKLQKNLIELEDHSCQNIYFRQFPLDVNIINKLSLTH